MIDPAIEKFATELKSQMANVQVGPAGPYDRVGGLPMEFWQAMIDWLMSVERRLDKLESRQ